MKQFCLPINDAKKFVEKFRKGELSFSKLNSDSETRLKYFEGFLDKEKAKQVNIAFEKGLARKNKIEGYNNWLSTVKGDMQRIERLRAKIKENNEERMRRIFSPKEDEQFLKSLAEDKLGISVSKEETTVIYELSRKMQKGQELYNPFKAIKRLEEAKGKLTKDQTEAFDSFMDKVLTTNLKKTELQKAKRRLKSYLTKGEQLTEAQIKKIDEFVEEIANNRKEIQRQATAKIALDEFIVEQKLIAMDAQRTKAKDIFKEFRKGGSPFTTGTRFATQSIVDIAGFAKTAASTLDASFLGRQGRVALYNAMTRGTISSSAKLLTGGKVGDNRLWSIFLEVAKANYGTLFGNKALGGKQSLLAVRQRIAMRKNAINGYYERAKLDVGVVEEAFPSPLPEKIPVLGRGTKASNEAFTASAYTLRALEFDRLVENAVKNEIEMTDEQLKAIGSLVNSMSGRGMEGIGKAGKVVNVALFSPKFLQSTLDILSAHQFSKTATDFTRKEARKNLMAIVGGVALTLWVADKWGASIETDPRSSDFGKIRVGDRRFDVTGGLSGIVTLVSRFAGLTTGGNIAKSTTTGTFSTIGDFGGKDAGGLFIDFFENKSSPALSGLLSVMNNQNFDRQPVRDMIKEDPINGLWILGKDMILPISLYGAVEGGYKRYFLGEKGEESDASFIAGILADVNGISSNVYSFSQDFYYAKTQEAEAMKKAYSKEKIDKVSKEYSTKVNLEVLRLRDTETFRNASNDDKIKIIDKKKREIKKEVFLTNKIVVKMEEDPKEEFEFNKLYRELK